MAELILEEQAVKKPSQFLKVIDDSQISIKSNLVKVKTHFIKAKNQSTICTGNAQCVFCNAGVPSRHEYFYIGELNNGENTENGLIRIPSSVFYSINEQEAVIKKRSGGKDKRMFAWIITKKGEGLQTKYTVTRADEITPPTPEELEANNNALVEQISKYEVTLKAKYEELSVDAIFLSKVGGAGNAQVQEPVEPEPTVEA